MKVKREEMKSNCCIKKTWALRDHFCEPLLLCLSVVTSRQREWERESKGGKFLFIISLSVSFDF